MERHRPSSARVFPLSPSCFRVALIKPLFTLELNKTENRTDLSTMMWCPLQQIQWETIDSDKFIQVLLVITETRPIFDLRFAESSNENVEMEKSATLAVPPADNSKLQLR